MDNSSNYYKQLELIKAEAQARFLIKQYESAIALADQILLIDSQDYDSLTMRAMSLENLGYYLDAIDDYNKALKLKPTDGNLFGLCGLCYNTIGNFRKAREYLEVAVNKGHKIYITNLNMINGLSEEILEILAKRKDTPEKRKRRSEKDFTSKNEALRLGTFYENLKDFYINLKFLQKQNPEDAHLNKMLDYYRLFFEEN